MKNVLPILMTLMSVHCGYSEGCETPNPAHDPTDPSSVACLESDNEDAVQEGTLEGGESVFSASAEGQALSTDEEGFVLGPAEDQLLSTHGYESDHVGKGCNTEANASNGGDEAYGFCVDESADGVDYCNDVLGGKSISGYCDGGPTRCCSNVACDAYSNKGVLATGICLGLIPPTQGGNPPPLPQCDGFIWMNSNCPNDALTGSDGNVGCCVAPEAGSEY